MIGQGFGYSRGQSSIRSSSCELRLEELENLIIGICDVASCSSGFSWRNFISNMVWRVYLRGYLVKVGPYPSKTEHNDYQALS
jgi:hypothetical protein